MSEPSEEEKNVWSGLRQHWVDSAEKEKPQREKWARLKGWQPMGNHPTDGTRFLMRHLSNLPFMAYVDGKGRMWAMEAGDMWPHKETEDYYWRPPNGDGNE